MPFEKNQIVPLTITGVTAEGNGVGRLPAEETDETGMAVFVPYTAIGDEIQCRLVKIQKTYAYGRVEEMLKPSSSRLPEEETGCSVYGKCGGCTWRHVQYGAELQYKWQRVADALSRIGGMDIVPESIVGCTSPDHYRNKAQYPVAKGEYRPMVGFYAPRSHRIMEQRNCPLQPVSFSDILQAVVQWAKKTGADGYDEEAKTGLLRHIYIREAKATGEIMVCLVCTSGKIPQPKLLAEKVQAAAPHVVSIVVNINKEDTNVILGNAGFTLWGKDYITDILCGMRFRLSPRSFYQVNHDQAEVLYRLAAVYAQLTGEETLLDLYCGTGTIGLSMASKVKRLIGVEVAQSAVEDARKNAEENGIDNAAFICADASAAADTLYKEGIHPDVVVIDPPRKGCDAALIETISDMSPSRVVYVSCDPATLARDLKLFGEKGYVTQKVAPVDMFPRTPHVECVALLTRTN